MHYRGILPVKSHYIRDGPVETAARRALEKANVDLALPWMHEDCEEDLRTAFQMVVKIEILEILHKSSNLWTSGSANQLQGFSSRVKRRPYTGLKPSGFDEGPIIPLADKALETLNADG